MHLQMCGGEEKGENTRMRSLALPCRIGPGWAGRGVAWRGQAMGGGARRVCE
jgi:hypothetical protein